VSKAIAENPEGFSVLVGGLFAILRLVTKGKVAIE
jgi:hypothetical protein